MINADLLITNANIISDSQQIFGAVVVKDEKIHDIIPTGHDLPSARKIIDAKNKFLIPGVIDDQVHFREPGLTHKADIYSESKAAVAGGVTSFMEMPNTIPQTTTLKELEAKHQIAEKNSFANFSFYLGATNNNIDELIHADPGFVCGIKIFMGSSTGNMLVSDESVLSDIFQKAKLLIATHCEDDPTIAKNLRFYQKKYNDNIPVKYHPSIRSAEACKKSSALAVKLAKQYDTRLHVLHLSTESEMELFSNQINRKKKRITAEVCVHHLFFNDGDYENKGSFIKWNPAIKTSADQKALIAAMIDGRIDVVATDHAPHTFEEKNNDYMHAPSGGPLVQHSLPVMMNIAEKNNMSIEQVVDKMCHAPADLFQVDKRGYIREGYWADLVLVDFDSKWEVTKNNILYKCGWSPFEGYSLKTKVTHTIVNGHLVYENGAFADDYRGRALKFNRS